MDDVAFVALGSNLGDRDAHLAAARARIARIPGISIIAMSGIEETAPIGPVPQGNYLNQMIALRTALNPEMLLSELHRVEQLGNRTRSTRWGPRTIDLDIVKYARSTWNSPDLQVPHPEINNRDFWQRELAELEEVVT
jgi:2-amino-4-hydroxy-6-hydroxymethyldihydropteridine diphosphokinase